MAERKEKEPFTTFEELGISAPYVKEFRDKFGDYPTLSITKYCKLPLRYPSTGGKKVFRMHPLDEGREIQVTGTEPGKRVATNIICKHKDGEFVLEPKMVEKFCKVVNPYHASFKGGEHKKKASERPNKAEKKPKSDYTPPPSKLKEIVQKRKKEAKFAL